MRIAIPTRFAHSVGGVETYLEGVLPALAARGHAVKVWHEINLPAGVRPLIGAGVQRQRLGSSTADVRSALLDMRRWQPDVVFSQGIARPSAELEMMAIAPFVSVLHAYQGTCISGFKTHGFPTPTTCRQSLGPACLLQFHARRCGGWSPVTMARDYVTQLEHREVLRRANGIITLSGYMRDECVRQGVAPDRVECVAAFAPPLPPPSERRDIQSARARRYHLAFAGRMERLKGAHLLLDALHLVAPALLTSLEVTMVGDGIERGKCERLATTLRRTGGVVHFPGWVTRDEWTRILQRVDLLVVPSVWPEPLGLIGLEAASMGVPALAFNVGGIGDWLTDGETGRLLEARPAADVLARGIEDCLSDRDRLQRWGDTACQRASRRTVNAHVEGIEAVLRTVQQAVTVAGARS